MAETALVTGGYGFIGRYVAKRLAERGITVIAIGHGAWARSEWREWGISEWHDTDVTLETLSTYGGDAQSVFHCAGSGSVAFSTSHPHQDFQRSVVTTQAVLEYARLSAPHASLVFPSSAAVYGLATTFPISESAALNPVSPYGVHKSIGEQICRSYAHHFGLSVAVVRLFSVYGVGLRKQLLWDACSKLQRGETSFHGTGEEARDWIDVIDAADLLLAAKAQASKECAIANGGCGQAVTVRAILQHVARELGQSEQLKFSGQVRVGDPFKQEADINRAVEWGWKPSRGWQTGISQYVDWFRKGAL